MMSGEEHNTLTVYSGRVLAALQRDTNTVRPRLDARYLYTRSFPGLYPETPAPIRTGMPRHSPHVAGARVKRQSSSLPSLEVALGKKISPRLDSVPRMGDDKLKTSSQISEKMQRDEFPPSWKERRDKLKPTRTTGGQTEPMEKRHGNEEATEQDDSNATNTIAKPRETRYNELPGLSTKIEVTLPSFQPGSGSASSPSVLSPLSPHGKVHLAGPMNKMDKIVEYSTQLKEGVIDYDMYMTKLALLSLQTQIRDVPRRSASKGPKGELRISKVNIEDAIDHISAGPLVRSDAPVQVSPEPLLYRKLTTTRPTIPHNTRVIVGHSLTRRRGADRSRYPRAPFPMYDWNLHQAETLLKRNFGFYNYNSTQAKTKPPSRGVLRPLDKPPIEIRPKTFRLPSFGRIPTASREGSVDPRAALSSRGKLPTPAGSDVFQGHLKNVYASIEKAKNTQDENGGETPIPIVLSPATEDTKPEQDLPDSGGRPDLLQLPSSLALPPEVPLATGITVPTLGVGYNVPGTPPLAVPGSPPPRSGRKLDPNADNSLMVVPIPNNGEKTVSFSAKLEVFMPDSPDSSEATTDMDFI